MNSVRHTVQKAGKEKFISSDPQEKDPGGFVGGAVASLRTPTPTALTRSQRYEIKRYQARKEAKAEYIRQWRIAHPEAKQKENQLRKERMGGVLRNFNPAERELLRKKQQGLCGLCGEFMQVAHVDHIVPLSKGGLHSLENAHLVHPQCNLAKGVKLVPVASALPRRATISGKSS